MLCAPSEYTYLWRSLTWWQAELWTDLVTWVCRCESALFASAYVCLLVMKPICRVATDSPSLCDFCSSPCQRPIFNPTVLSVLVRDLKIQSNHPCTISSQLLLSLPRCGTKSAFPNVVLKAEILLSPFWQAGRKSSQIRIFCLSVANKNVKIKIYRTVILPYFVWVWNLVSQIEGGT